MMSAWTDRSSRAGKGAQNESAPERGRQKLAPLVAQQWRCYLELAMNKLATPQMQAEICAHLGPQQQPLIWKMADSGPRTYKARPRANIDAAETRGRVRRRLSKTLAYLATR